MGRLVYAAFDRFPAPKGAAVHIARFTSALAAEFGELDLLTLPPLPDTEGSPTSAIGSGVRHQPFAVTGDTTIARALDFRGAIARWWATSAGPVSSVHFRSIFEGYPIARRRHELCDRLVFEVNGLPSIELKYHYPAVADDRELQLKLDTQERVCIDAADLLITPSRVTADHLRSLGATPDRIRVIPNGVDLELFGWRAPEPEPIRPLRLLYWGTMASWQGVPAALEALRLYRRDFAATLTLVGPSNSPQRRTIHRCCDDLGIAPFVELRPPVGQQALAALVHAHDVVLAPLMPNDRNLVQGCCPLKVLEAMAAGTPLVASDMPVVTDLAEDGVHALLVRPGSGKAIKDALLRLRDEPDLGRRLSIAARRRVEERFAWSTACAALVSAYEEMLGAAPVPAAASTRASASRSRSG